MFFSGLDAEWYKDVFPKNVSETSARPRKRGGGSRERKLEVGMEGNGQAKVTMGMRYSEAGVSIWGYGFGAKHDRFSPHPQVQMQMGNEREKQAEVSSSLMKLELCAEGAPGARCWRESRCMSLFPSAVRLWLPIKSPGEGAMANERKGSRERDRDSQSIIRRRLKGQVGKCLHGAPRQAWDYGWPRRTLWDF